MFPVELASKSTYVYAMLCFAGTYFYLVAIIGAFQSAGLCGYTVNVHKIQTGTHSTEHQKLQGTL